MPSYLVGCGGEQKIMLSSPALAEMGIASERIDSPTPASGGRGWGWGLIGPVEPAGGGRRRSKKTVLMQSFDAKSIGRDGFTHE